MEEGGEEVGRGRVCSRQDRGWAGGEWEVMPYPSPVPEQLKAVLDYSYMHPYQLGLLWLS